MDARRCEESRHENIKRIYFKIWPDKNSRLCNRQNVLVVEVVRISTLQTIDFQPVFIGKMPMLRAATDLADQYLTISGSISVAQAVIPPARL